MGDKLKESQKKLDQTKKDHAEAVLRCEQKVGSLTKDIDDFKKQNEQLEEKLTKTEQAKQEMEKNAAINQDKIKDLQVEIEGYKKQIQEFEVKVKNYEAAPITPVMNTGSAQKPEERTRRDDEDVDP